MNTYVALVDALGVDLGIPVVTSYSYLGMRVSDRGDAKTALAIVEGMIGSAYKRWSRILRNGDIRARINIFIS